jgi:photosystem II stability/assembly factor-like uncharacterized protein
MKKLCFTILLFSLQSFIFAQPWEWQWQNAKPVGNALYDVQALTSTRLVAFGTSGLVLISTDAGDTWQSSYPDASRRDIWGSYFLSSTTGFMVGAGGLIMKTTDGGDTWVSKTSNTTNILYDIEFYDASNGIACGAAGTIDRTTDGGENWVLSTATSSGSNYKVSIVSSTVVYVGTSNSAGRLIKSTDFGVTFSNATPALVSAGSVYGMYVLNSTNYWIVTALGIIATTDGGTSWTNQQAQGNIMYDVKFISSTTGFAVDAKGIVWATTNAGTLWTSTQLSTIKQIRSIGYNAVSGNLFLVGDCGNLYKSTNTGTSWTAKYTSATQEQIRRILFKDDNNGWAGDGVGVLLKTTDGGQNWTTLYNLGHQVQSIAMPTSTTWYIGCDAGFYYKTTDGGTSFSALTFPVGGVTFWNTAFADSLIGYAGGSSGKFFKTTNGGSSWTDISTAAGFGSNVIYDIALIDANTFYISGLGAKLSKTTNGGTSFSPLSPGVTGAFFGVKFKDANLGLVGGGSLALSRTTDAGATWTPITLPAGPASNASIWGIAFKNNNAWISTINGDVLYSTDNGATWTNAKKPTSATLYYMAVSNNNLWICGTQGNIIKGNASPLSLTLNLSALIDWFYDGSTMVSDIVKVELHNATTPYAMVDSNSVVLSSTGVGNFIFTNVVNGTPYYIVVKHRNAVETWSASTVTFVSGAASYDFTTAQTQAYGSNLALHGTKWCLYNGDVNQDGSVDGTDLGSVDNDNNAFVTGYTVTDLNGDNAVDGSDLGIVDNNNNAFIFSVFPTGAPNAIRVQRPVHTNTKNSNK